MLEQPARYKLLVARWLAKREDLAHWPCPGLGRARLWALARSFDGFNPVATAQQISERGFRRTSRVKVSGFLDRKALGLQSI